MTKTLIGTPYYMAPEQAAGHGTPVGPPADIYALGAILYELLTGTPPFHGKSVLEVLDRVRTEDPIPPRQIAPDVPLDLETICLKCLKKSPAERYASARDLAEDLRRFRADEPIRARPTGLLERTGKWVRRRPALAGIVAVTILAASVLALLDLQFRYSLRAKIHQTRAEERGQLQDARAAYQSFAKHRGDALFHWSFASQFPSDAVKHLEATRQSVRQGLALAGCGAGRGAPVLLNPLWSEREKAEVLAGTYQLFLVLAEANAIPLPGESAEAHHDRLRQALGLLDRMAANMPHTQAYHLRRARYLERLDDAAGAQRERDLAKGLTPASLLDHLLLGDELFQQRDFGRAAQSFQQALLAEPGDFWARFLLAICKLNLQDPAAAEEGLNQCLAQRPDFTWALLYRGSARGERGRFEAGESDFRQALKVELPADARYVVLMARSRLRSRAEQPVRAIADLEEAVALLPDQFHARFNLARLLQAQGRLAESNVQFESALRLLVPLAEKDRDLARIAAECQMERSRNLRLSKDPSKAFEAAESACKIAPDRADAWQCRALALLELNRFADVRTSLDQFLANGGKPGPDFYAARGRARMQLGDYLGAKDDYTHGLDFGPGAELFNHRGWAYAFADAWKPALHDFEEAVRLAPRNADAVVGRGLARVMLGQLAEGLADADDAFRLEPRTPEMMHNLACIFALAVGKGAHDPIVAERAVAAIRKCLAMVPAAQRHAFWRDKIFPDKALDAVRDLANFQELEEAHAKPPRRKE